MDPMGESERIPLIPKDSVFLILSSPLDWIIPTDNASPLTQISKHATFATQHVGPV